MADEVFTIAADYNQLIGELRRLSTEFLRAAGAQQQLIKATTSVGQGFDEEGKAAELLTTKLTTVDALGRKVSSTFENIAGKISLTNQTIQAARKEYTALADSIKNTLSVAAQEAKQALGQKVPRTDDLQSLFIKSTQGADPALVDKFQAAFANLIKTQGTVKLTTDELAATFAAFFKSDPSNLFFGMRTLFDELQKVQKAATAVKSNLSDLGVNVNKAVEQTFKKVLLPALPTPLPQGTPKEEAAATKAESDLKDFLARNTTFSQRQIELTLQSISKGTIDRLGPVKREFGNLFLAAQKAYNDIGAVAERSAQRQRDAQAVLGTKLTGVTTVGADEGKVLAFEKAQRDLVSLFVKSNIEITKFDQLLASAGSTNRLTAVEESSKAIYEQMIRLVTTVRALDSELTKTGQALVQAAQGDVTKQFRDAKITADQFKTSLAAVQASTTSVGPPLSASGAQNLTLLEDKIRNAIDLNVKQGRTSTEAAIEIQKAIDIEIAAMAKREAKDQADAAARKARSDERLRQARLDATAAAVRETAEKAAVHPTVVSAFTQASAATGLGFDRPIPAFAKPEQIDAINTGFQNITNTIVKGKIELARFEEIVRNVRTILSLPKRDQIFAPLADDEQKIQEQTISLERTFKSIKSTGAEAGRSVLLSWQGVFRLFQAQVIHTALSQLIADFRQAAFEVGNFQKEVALIQTITQDQPTTFNEWSDSVRRVADELGKPATEVATAAYETLSNQITNTREETEKFIGIAGQLGKTTGGTTLDAVNILTSAIKSFDFTAGDADTIASKLFATVDLGRVKISELSSNFGRTTALGKALGVSLDDVLAGLTVITGAGVKSSEAQTELNNVFQKLLRPTEATKQLFDELGVTTGEQLVRINGLGGALQILAKATEEGRVSASDFFNEIRGAKGFFTLAEDGARNFEKAIKDINNTQGRFRAAQTIAAAPPGVELQRQLAQISSFITEDFGGKAAATIISLTSSIGGLSNAFKTSFKVLEDEISIAIRALASFTLVYTAAFSVNAINNWIVSLQKSAIATKSLQFVLGELGAAIDLAFEKNPAFFFAAAAAIIGAAIGGIIVHAQRAKEEMIRGFNEERDAALKTAADISEAFAKSNQKQTEDLKKSVDANTAKYLQGIAVTTKGLRQWAADHEDVLTSIQSAFKISFEGIIDDFKNGIAASKKATADAQKGIGDLRKFGADLADQAEKDLFERQVKQRPDLKVPLTLQRASVLQQKGATLLGDPATTAEGLNLLKEGFTAATSLADIFPRISQLAAKANRDIALNFATNAAKDFAKSDFSKPYQTLISATEKYKLLETEVSHTIEGQIALDRRRHEAALAVNRATVTAAQLPKSTDTTRQVLADKQKINFLTQQAVAYGLDQASAEALVVKYLLQTKSILEESAKDLQKRKEESQRLTDAQEINVRHLNDLYKELANIKFTDKEGNLKPLQERNRLREREKDINEKIVESMLEEGKILEAVNGSADWQRIAEKIENFKKLFGEKLFRENVVISDLGDIEELQADGKAIQENARKTTEEITRSAEVTRAFNEEQNRAVALAKSLANIFAQSPNKIKGTAFTTIEDIDKVQSDAKRFAEAIGSVGGGVRPTAAIGGLEDLKKSLSQLPQTGAIAGFIDNINAAIQRIKGGESAASVLDEIRNSLLNLKDATRPDLQTQITGIGTAFNLTAEKIKGGATLTESIQLYTQLRNTIKGLGESTAPITIIDEKGNAQVTTHIGLLDIIEKKLKVATDAQRNLNDEQSRLTTGTQVRGNVNIRNIFGGDPVDINNDVRKRFASIRDVFTDEVRETDRVFLEGANLLKSTADKINSILPELPAERKPPTNLPPPTKFDDKELEDALDKSRKAQEKLDQGFIEAIPNSLIAAGAAFDQFSSRAVIDIQNVTNAINAGLVPALNNIKPSSGNVQTASTGGLFFASGGLVPIMTTPGEAFIAPNIAAKYLSQLMQMNRGFTPKGTDTQPAFVPPGTFILNKASTRRFLGSSGIQYLEQGGLTFDSSFSPTLSTFNRTFNPQFVSKSDGNVSMGDIHVNIEKSHVSTSEQALQLGKAIQRQIRIGRLNK